MIKWIPPVRRWLALIVFLGAFALYLRTLAPSVAQLFDDSLEFQLVGYKLAIAHPTGYPLYTLLLKLFTLLPMGEVAGRANLSSAVFAALAVALVFRIALKLTGTVLPSLAAAAALAVSPVFWSQAVIAEVYALNAALIAGAILILISRPSPRSGQPPDPLPSRVSHDPTSSNRRGAPALMAQAARGDPDGPNAGSHAYSDLAPLAFLVGLMLTHHRTGLLLLPAAALYLWLAAECDWRTLWAQAVTHRTVLAFLLPLALYSYLPLRGDIGSLDGTYQNTPDGFARWILASGYNIFLTGNPFNEHYDAAFFAQLFVDQFGWLGLAVVLLGLRWLLKRRLAAGLFLLAAFATYLAFVVSYRVPDVQVFAIPAFLIMALAFGCGLHALVTELPALVHKTWTRVNRDRQMTTQTGARPAEPSASGITPGQVSDTVAASRIDGAALSNVVGATGSRPFPSAPLTLVDATRHFVCLALIFIILAPAFPTALATNDLGGHTELRDYGRDMLAQPLPTNSSLVGILGEMTLVRYFQAAEGLQPALTTIAADRNADRLDVIDREITAGHAVFTTRLLNGLPEKYSLGALGPLVSVLPQAQPGTLPPDAARVANIKYRIIGTEQHGESIALMDLPGLPQLTGSRFLRVHVAWEPTAPITADLKISARLLYPGSDQMIGQRDDWPVHNAYHTTFWRPGEQIQDVYDIPLSFDRAPTSYRLLLIVYRADSGAELGRVDGGRVVIQ